MDICRPYPKIGQKLELGIVLSHDVTNVNGHWSIAFRQKKSDMRLFGRHYLACIAAAFSTELITHAVVVGGPEEEYAIGRATAIRTEVVSYFGVPARSIQAVRSPPSTLGNAQAMSAWLQAHFTPLEQCVGITSIWHCLRAEAFFRENGMDLPFVPAESIWLAESDSDAARDIRAKLLFDEFGGSDLADTMVSEAMGISRILDDTYECR